MVILKPFCGDAHDQEDLESEQGVFERVPEVGDEEDEHLVLYVLVPLLGVCHEGDDQEDVHQGQAHQTLLEGRLALTPGYRS